MDLDEAERTSLTRGLLRGYVEGSALRERLAANNIPCFPTVRYVSYIDRTLRLLVCGDCPGCAAPFIRNVCNVQFCDTCHELMKQAFPVIRKVVPVLTTDTDINEVVAEKGMSMRYVVNPTESKNAYSIMKCMLDFDPNIDGTMKVLSLRGRNLERIDLGGSSYWNEMIDRYNALWMIDDSVKVVDEEGNIAVGEEVLRDEFSLPQYIVDMHPDDSPVPMLMSYNPNYFSVRRYFKIE